MDVWLVFRFTLFFILLLFSAFFSGAEVAFFSLSPSQVDALREKHGKTGKLVAKLLETPRRMLVTIYIGNELINVSIAAISTIIALHYFEDNGLAIAVGVSTFMLLVFGEITPKTFALKYSEKYALAAVWPLSIFSKVVYPVQSAVTWMTNRLLSLFGGGASESAHITEDEIKTMLTHGESNGVIESGEKEMILNVFELGDTTVTEIMKPRTEIFAFPIEDGFTAITRRAALSDYSRIPVYEKDIDHIKGIIYTKDLLSPKKVRNIESLLRKPYFIPATKKVDELLREFRKSKIHMAVILDEYGGVEGLVTLEDILEEVVGEPADQKGIDRIVKLEQGYYKVPARMELDDFNSYFKTSLAHDDTNTVGGLVFHLFGRIPRWGETVSMPGVIFTVRKLKGQMISQLSVRIVDKEKMKANPEAPTN